MPIVIGHEPVEAVGEGAYAAGNAEFNYQNYVRSLAQQQHIMDLQHSSWMQAQSLSAQRDMQLQSQRFQREQTLQGQQFQSDEFEHQRYAKQVDRANAISQANEQSDREYSLTQKRMNDQFDNAETLVDQSDYLDDDEKDAALKAIAYKRAGIGPPRKDKDKPPDIADLMKSDMSPAPGGGFFHTQRLHFAPGLIQPPTKDTSGTEWKIAHDQAMKEAEHWAKYRTGTNTISSTDDIDRRTQELLKKLRESRQDNADENFEVTGDLGPLPSDQGAPPADLRNENSMGFSPPTENEGQRNVRELMEAANAPEPTELPKLPPPTRDYILKAAAYIKSQNPRNYFAAYKKLEAMWAHYHSHPDKPKYKPE